MRFKGQSFRRLMYPSIFTPVLLLLSQTAIAQTPKPPKDEAFTRGIDISLGTLGQLTFARTPTTSAVFPYGTDVTQATQSQSPSPGALFTFHGAIKPCLGYSVNFSYTRFTQSDSFGQGFTPAPGTTAIPGSSYLQVGSLDTHMYELTLAYAFYGPRSKRLRTFGQLGGGGLFFEPMGASFAHQQTRPTMVFGVGAEYDISRHLSVRAEYRGLFYKMPDFAIDNGFPKQRLFTVTNAPAISLVYRFGFSSKKSLAKTH